MHRSLLGVNVHEHNECSTWRFQMPIASLLSFQWNVLLVFTQRNLARFAEAMGFGESFVDRLSCTGLRTDEKRE